MTIPTEPIGSIPRPVKLLEAVATAGDNGDPKLDELYDAAIRDAIERFEATGSPVISDARTEKVIATSARTPFTTFPFRTRWYQDPVRYGPHPPDAPTHIRTFSL